MEMSETDKYFIAQLEAMPIEQARREIAMGAFGRPGSQNHVFALSWLTAKEAEEREKREEARHHEIQNKLEELKKPHRPSFCLLVISVTLTFLALCIGIAQLPQVQKAFFEKPSSPEKKGQLQSHEQKQEPLKKDKAKK